MEIIGTIMGFIPAITEIIGKLGLNIDLTAITDVLPNITELVNQIIALF